MPSIEEVQAFVSDKLPKAKLRVDSLADREGVVTYFVDADDLGYGNAVSGPAIMKMADTAFYIVLLGELGFDTALAASSLNFAFLRKPPGGVNLRGHCKLLKVGRRLIVAELTLYSEGDRNPVAHALGTYTLV